MPIKIIRNSFNCGEVSETMSGRTDLQKYYNACSELVNATSMPQGGIVKRSGTIFVGKTKEFPAWKTSVAYPVGCVVSESSNLYYCLVAHTSGTFATDLASANWELVEAVDGDSSKVKLFSFEFSATDSHILEFGTRYMRVYKNQARVYETEKTIASITLSSTSPVRIHLHTHGYTTGNTVRFTSMVGTVELDEKEYIVTYVDADNFDLYGTDSSDFSAFTSGKVKKIYEIATPYNSTEIFEIHKAQSADVMYITHEDHHPKSLSRYADTNWTIADTAFVGGAFLTENTDSAKLINFTQTGGTSASGYYFPVGATGTLTASGTGNTPFNENHVGSLWLLRHTRQDNKAEATTGYVGDTGGIRIKGDFNVNATNFATDGSESIDIQRKEGNGDFQSYYTTNSAIAYSSTEKSDDVYYRVSITGTVTCKLTASAQINYGIVRITAYTSATQVTCEVVKAVYRAGGTGTTSGTTAMWAEGAWSDYRGYPRTVSFYEDRLYFASTTYNPQTLWGSVVGEYLNFATGDTDSDAIILPLNANDISQIQWIMANRSMIVGTASAEFVLSASNPDDPMTPTDKKSRPISNYGSNGLQPVILNNGLFFFQRQGRKLRVMTYAYEIDTFKAEDATLLADHILEVQPTSMAVQMIPDSIIWVTREDGTLCAFCYEPSENIFAAWSRMVTGSTLLTPTDFYESVAVINGDTEDELWQSVKREIDSKDYRYIEYSAPRLIDNIEDSVMVDSAVVAESVYSTKNITFATDTVLWDEGDWNSGLWY